MPPAPPVNASVPVAMVPAGSVSVPAPDILNMTVVALAALNPFKLALSTMLPLVALVAFSVSVLADITPATVMLGVTDPLAVSVNWKVPALDVWTLVTAESVIKTEPAAFA